MNIHPALTAFPLALITLTVILEVAVRFDLFKCPQILPETLVLASGIFTILAFFSGYQAAELANGSFIVPEELIATHHQWGRLLLFAMLPCVALKFISNRAIIRQQLFSDVYLAFLIFCFGLVLYTGSLGGELIFGYGAGVRLEG